MTRIDCKIFETIEKVLRKTEKGRRTSDFGLRTSDFGLQTSDFCQSSPFVETRPVCRFFKSAFYLGEIIWNAFGYV